MKYDILLCLFTILIQLDSSYKSIDRHSDSLALFKRTLGTLFLYSYRFMRLIIGIIVYVLKRIVRSIMRLVNSIIFYLLNLLIIFTTAVLSFAFYFNLGNIRTEYYAYIKSASSYSLKQIYMFFNRKFQQLKKQMVVISSKI